MLVVVAQRLMQARSRLEGNLEPAAGLNELGQGRHGRDRGAAAAHLGAEPELLQLEDPERDVVAQRQLDVDLGSRVEEDLRVDPGSLDGLDPLVGLGQRAGVEDDRQPKRLVTDVAELRGRAHEAVDDPAVLVGPDAAMLGQALGERQLLGRERRSVVDETCEESSSRVDRSRGVHPASVNPIAGLVATARSPVLAAYPGVFDPSVSVSTRALAALPFSLPPG